MDKEVQTLFFVISALALKTCIVTRGVALKTNNYAFLVMNYLVESEKNSIFAAKWLQDHWRRIRENLSEGRGEDSKMTWHGFCLVTD